MWKHLQDQAKARSDADDRGKCHEAWQSWSGKDHMTPVEQAAARVAWEAAWAIKR